MEYWTECIGEAFCDADIKATEEQIKLVAEWVDGAHENYGTATGSEHIPNPLNSEVDRLERKIKQLTNKYNLQIEGVLKGVAQRRNTNLSNVNIDDRGLITYK